MGKVCFSKCFRYACLAAVTLAAAFLAAIAFANTASARETGGDGNKGTLKEWDTDNLSRWVSAYRTVGAKNYRIPYHNYRGSGYKETVPAKACVAYNIRDSNRNYHQIHLRTQNTISGQCPSGYSLVTQVCAYSGYTPYGGYNSGGGYYVPVVSQPASYRVPNSAGTCDRISYRPAVNCHTSGNLRTYCSAGAKRSVNGSLISVPHVNLCRDRYGRFSLRRSASNCSAAYAHRVPLHVGCQSAVADAFFQTGGATGAVNDFPVADYGSESEAGSVAATGNRDRGCVEFAKQQDRLQASVAATGHYLALENGDLVLKANSGTDILDTRITSVRSAGVYGRWGRNRLGHRL